MRTKINKRYKLYAKDGKYVVESGQTLYLKEHTEETRKLRKTIEAIAIVIFFLLIMGIIYIKYFHVVAYPVAQLREIASKCGGLK